eukprot:1407465-Prymnesium_polylepis.2
MDAKIRAQPLVDGPPGPVPAAQPPRPAANAKGLLWRRLGREAREACSARAHAGGRGWVSRPVPRRALDCAVGGRHSGVLSRICALFGRVHAYSASFNRGRACRIMIVPLVRATDAQMSENVCMARL